MIAPYFENNWHLNSQKAINLAYDNIRDAIANKLIGVSYESTYCSEVKTYIESVSNGLFKVKHGPAVVDYVFIEINIDYSKLSVRDYVTLRKSVGDVEYKPSKNYWLRFLGFLASIGTKG